MYKQHIIDGLKSGKSKFDFSEYPSKGLYNVRSLCGSVWENVSYMFVAKYSYLIAEYPALYKNDNIPQHLTKQD